MIHTAQEIADLFKFPLAQIEEWAEEEKIVSARLPDGTLLVPLGAFQTVLPTLVDLEADLKALNEAAADIDPETIRSYFESLDRE